jgi:hypothetical protein
MKHEHPLEYERITGVSLDDGHAKGTEDITEETG